MLKFDEIITSILSSSNKHEKEHGITTETVSLIDKKDSIAFFLAKKSDNTNTLFFAYRPSKTIDHWVWCCPNKEHVSTLTERLKEVITKEKPTHTKCYDSMIQLDKNGIEKTIKSLFKTEIKLKHSYSGETINLYVCDDNDGNRYLFIAFKPSKQYDKWFLFAPTKEQAFALINELSKYYVGVDANNENTRWT